jgi:DNA-binding CsgD family transcriptional regulator
MALGLPIQATLCGYPAVVALLWRGRLEEAEQRLEELDELGLPTSGWHGCPELLLARGAAHDAAPSVRHTAAFAQAAGRVPWDTEVQTELQLAGMLDDQPGALATARSYLAQLDECDSPLIAASAARIGFQALCVGCSMPAARTGDLWDRAARQLQRSRDGLTEDWRGTYYGVQLALAEAYAAKSAREPAIVQFRVASSLAMRFGAYFSLEPRLNLAAELLAHGDRDEGRELPVECWTTARDMGAHDLERRATRLATRTRVPLPESAGGRGPLSRLTPRELEVLGHLATGATNKTIAEALVISEKTASVHVSNLLGKLGVANRGAAAALARQLGGG